MKDNKNIAIIVLIAVCCILAFFAFRQSGSDYKKELKELQKANAVLIEERKQIAKNLEKLQAEYTTLEASKNALDVEISSLEDESKRLKDSARKSQENLDRLKADLAETRKQIAEREKHPANRTDEDLLNSLRIKTGKK